jgi:hypothetical protein
MTYQRPPSTKSDQMVAGNKLTVRKGTVLGVAGKLAEVKFTSGSVEKVPINYLPGKSFAPVAEEVCSSINPSDRPCSRYA